MWAAGTPTYVTIQTTGIYVVTFTGQITATATLTRVLAVIAKNGQTTSQGIAMQDTFGSTIESLFSVALTTSYTAGDTITAKIIPSGGSAYAIKGNANELHAQTRLTATWIGRTS
jgi:exosome complex RNA-binding protein Csl4